MSGRVFDEQGNELKPLYNCPVCAKDYKTENGFKKHLDGHFTKDQTGTMVQIFKVKSVPPKEVVDAMCVDALSEMFKTFAVTANDQYRKLSLLDSFKAAMKISCDHLDLVRECLDPVQSATLANKHKVIKDVVPVWCSIATSIYEATKDSDSEEDFRVPARTILSIITDFHKILHEDTPQKERILIADSWKETFNGSAAEA